ncbi:MAG: crossover junction endodeoxyribonuclease RuvC [bacterium]|nr:crossover junction endodeoxyribonuclease RuvC [bacterium]
MVLISIDPGYAITGWAVIQQEKEIITLLDSGAIQVKEKKFYNRLLEITRTLDRLLSRYKPRQACIEKIFFNKNIKTAMDVAQVRGAISLILLKRDIPIFDYTPLQVKQAVAGYGQASKIQVQKMVQLLLNLKTLPTPDDMADAIALGICHIHSMKLKTLMERTEK